jgi:PAS domain S-box-containing protein
MQKKISLKTATQNRETDFDLLIHSDQFYRAVFEASNDALFIHDCQGVIRGLNPAGLKLLAYDDQNELIGSHFTNLFCHKDRERAESNGAARKTGEIDWKEKIDYSLLKKNGTLVEVEVSSAPIRDKEGCVLGWVANFNDITERKNNLDELRKNEERLRLVLEATSDGVWDRNFDTGEIYYSPTWKKMLGYEPDEVENTHEAWEKLIFPADRPYALEATQNLIDGKMEAINLEYRLLTKDGSYKWVLSRGKVLDWISPKDPRRVVGTHEDITGRKKTEETLQIERNLLSDGPVVLSQWSWQGEKKPGKLEFITRNIEQYGYSVEDFFSGRIRSVEFIHPKDRQRVGNESRHYFETGATHFSSTFRLVKADGEIRWVRNFIFVNRAESGEIINFYQYLLDVTNLRQVEEAYKNLVEQSLNAIMLFQKDRMVFANRATERIFGYSFEELKMFSIRNFLSHVEKDDQKIIREIILKTHHGKTSDQEIKEIRVSRKDAKIRWYEVTATSTDYEDGAAMQIACLDVTERKLAEEEMKNKLESEKQLLEQKSNFIFMTSHEFRTPLSAIMSSAELLDYYGHNWTVEKRQGHYRRIQQAAKNMNQMLEDILLLGKIESGKANVSPEKFCLVTTCKEVIEEARYVEKGRHPVCFRHRMDQLDVFMDKQIFRRILMNLLSNAIKFSSEDAEVSVDLHTDDQIIHIAVSDGGIGIQPEDIQKISQPFYRADNARNIPGSGLGLTVVQKSLETLGGSMLIESTVGHGARFMVYLPIHQKTFNAA